MIDILLRLYVKYWLLYDFTIKITSPDAYTVGEFIFMKCWNCKKYRNNKRNHTLAPTLLYTLNISPGTYNTYIYIWYPEKLKTFNFQCVGSWFYRTVGLSFKNFSRISICFFDVYSSHFHYQCYTNTMDYRTSFLFIYLNIVNGQINRACLQHIANSCMGATVHNMDVFCER